MRICLIPLKVETKNSRANFQQLVQKLDEASSFETDLICLPECALTGYLYEEEDLTRFAEPILGKTFEQIANLANRYGVYICWGMLESIPKGVYNSAVLVDRKGQLIHKHRKMSEQAPFLNGEVVSYVTTDLGKIGVLICGDLFHEEIVDKLEKPMDLLIVPMARSFDKKSPDTERWLRKERQVYLDAVKKVGCPTVIVNGLESNSDEASFGGAMVISAEGELLAESPHGMDKILIYDL